MMYLSLLIILPLLTGLIVIVTMNALQTTRYAISGVVGPYFTAVALLFGLFAGLIANETWQKTSRINSAIEIEASSLRGLLRISEVVPRRGQDIQSSVQEYLSIIRSQELTRARIEKKSEDATIIVALRRLYSFASQAENFNSGVMNTAFMDELNMMRQARLDRLQVMESHTSTIKMLFLVIFGFLTQIAIALCHAGLKRALFVTVMLFSITFSFTTSVIAIIDDPIKFGLVSLTPLDKVR